MSNEFVARKGLISYKSSSFLETVFISGSVGIGTQSNNYALNVSGSVNITGGLVVSETIVGKICL